MALLDSFPSRKYRVMEHGLIIPRESLLPHDESEFLRVAQYTQVPEDDREALLALFLAGYVVLYREWDNAWASRTGPISLDAMIAQYDRAVSRHQGKFRKLGQRLKDGNINLDVWYREMTIAIEDSHKTSALVIFGPLWLSVPALYDMVNGMIARELNYLSRFYQGIANGSVRLDGNFLRRIGMYINAARQTLWESVRLLSSSIGLRFEENILGIAEHCDGTSSSCVAQTARGKVPIGSLIPIGERDCLTNCHCRLQFS